MARSKRQSLRQASRTPHNSNSPAPPNALVSIVITSRPAAPSSGVTSPDLSMSTRSGTVEYDTPDTSNFVTPAASVSGRPSCSTSRMANTSKASALTMASPQPGTKRKRAARRSGLITTSDSVDTSRDEEIALQLQGEEYNTEEEEAAPPKKRGRSGQKAKVSMVIPDSEDENEELDLAVSDSSLSLHESEFDDSEMVDSANEEGAESDLNSAPPEEDAQPRRAARRAARRAVNGMNLLSHGNISYS
jgi:hypothetical protein